MSPAALAGTSRTIDTSRHSAVPETVRVAMLSNAIVPPPPSTRSQSTAPALGVLASRARTHPLSRTRRPAFPSARSGWPIA
jgi:hypothetical protein